MSYVGIAYLIFAFWVVTDLLRARGKFAEFPPGLPAFGALALVTLIGVAAALGFVAKAIPGGAFFPVPWLLAAFVPAFVVAKKLSTRYEVQGTARTQPLEDLCSKVHWLAVFGMVLVFGNLLYLWIGTLGAGHMPGGR